MKRIIEEIIKDLEIIRISIAGRYESETSLSNKEKEDIYDIEIPLLKEDRANLKRDRDNVSMDYLKAVQEKTIEFQH